MKKWFNASDHPVFRTRGGGPTATPIGFMPKSLCDVKKAAVEEERERTWPINS